MAQLEISLDTSNEDLVVRLNGKKLEGVTGVSIYKYMNYEGKLQYQMSVDLQGMEGDDVLSTHTYLTLTKADSKLGKQIAAEGRILHKDGDLIYFAK